MGLLRSLLLAPVAGPMEGTLWIARKIHEAADRELHDPAAIRRALRDLEVELESGRLDEAAFEEAEAVLLARLREGAR